MASEETARSRGRAAIPLLLKVIIVVGFIKIGTYLLLPPTGLIKSVEERAKGDAIQLEYAITAYFSEHREYPHLSASPHFERAVLSDKSLMPFLLGHPEASSRVGMSPRDVPHFVSAPAVLTDDGLLCCGLSVDENGDTGLWDAWGNHYRIIMDTDGDGRVKAPDWFTEAEFIPQGVIVWSPGPDGDDATAEDNVVSWSIDD